MTQHYQTARQKAFDTFFAWCNWFGKNGNNIVEADLFANRRAILDILKTPYSDDKCILPPEGWQCTRKAGHDGPCAAFQVAPPVTEVEALGLLRRHHDWMILNSPSYDGPDSPSEYEMSQLYNDTFKVLNNYPVASQPPADLSEDERVLKPWPFCGGEAERVTLEDEDNFGGDVITCKRCQASSHVELGRKENLVPRWNTRAKSDERAVYPKSRENIMKAIGNCDAIEMAHKDLKPVLDFIRKSLHETAGGQNDA